MPPRGAELGLPDRLANSMSRDGWGPRRHPWAGLQARQPLQSPQEMAKPGESGQGAPGRGLGIPQPVHEAPALLGGLDGVFPLQSLRHPVCVVAGSSGPLQFSPSTSVSLNSLEPGPPSGNRSRPGLLGSISYILPTNGSSGVLLC